MPTTKIEPTRDKPVPYDTSDDVVPTLLEELAVAGNTAELKAELVPARKTEADADREKKLLEAVAVDKSTAPDQPDNRICRRGVPKILWIKPCTLDVASARSAITNKLMEIANCGDTRYELKALELHRSSIVISGCSPNVVKSPSTIRTLKIWKMRSRGVLNVC